MCPKRAFVVRSDEQADGLPRAPIVLTIPAGSTTLKAIDVLAIDEYSNLYTKYSVTGGTIVPDSVESVGSPTFKGNVVPSSATLESGNTVLKTGTPVPS